MIGEGGNDQWFSLKGNLQNTAFKMNENNHVDMDAKKPDVTNNELMVDIKTGPSSVVIPSKPSEETKVDVVEKISSSISNSEVGVGLFLFHLVCNYDCEECNRNRLFGNTVFDCSSRCLYF